MRRRITWHLDTRTAIALLPGETLPTVFKWRNLPRPVEIEPTRSDGKIVYRDFLPEEDKFQLLWDETQCESFVSEVCLRTFVMRFVYDIDLEHLIPSEVLADGDLVYETGDWVDSWFCPDQNNEVIECPRPILRPKDRRIRFLASVQRDKPSEKPYWGNSYPAQRGPYTFEVAAKVELSAPKCFYTFRAGGHYEDRQKVQTAEKNSRAATP